MTLLAGTTYDPATAAAFSTASLAAMTAVDTSNLRLTFTAPANGIVIVRMRGVMHGATSSGQVLFGVLSAGSVVKRVAPMSGRSSTAGAANQYPLEAVFLVTGLTPGNSYTWDAAIGVEFAVASSGVKYGGPNNSTTNDAFGGFSFEVWSTPTLIAGACYDPAVAASRTLASASAMTAVDTSNLRLTFNAPASEKVLVRQRFMANGGTVIPVVLAAVLDGATVRARQAAMPSIVGNEGSPAATTHLVFDHEALVTGLVAGNSYTWDAAVASESTAASQSARWGGPDDATQDNAYGGYSFEIWAA